MSEAPAISKNSAKFSNLGARLEDLRKEVDDIRAELNTLKFDLGYAPSRRAKSRSRLRAEDVRVTDSPN